jgi:hypothetical protein
VLLIPLEYFQRHQPDLHTIKLNRRFPDNFPHHLIPGGELYPWPDILYKIYFYLYNEHVIWGMTSHILKSAVELIAAADLLAGLRG